MSVAQLRLSPFLGFFLFSTFLQARTISSLSEVREKLKAPEYTSAERETLIKQTQLTLRDLFVHRDLKVKDFGSVVDPLPRLEALKSNEVSASQLNLKLSQIFTDLRDFHTNYNGPRPLSCGMAFLPLRLVKAKDGERDALFVASKINIKAELVKNVKVGDELVGVDSLSADDALKALYPLSAGANQQARILRGVQLLTFRALSMQPVPAEDNRVFHFKNALGEKYEVTLPWQVLLEDNCLDSKPPVNRGTLHRPMSQVLNRGEDEFQKKFNKVFGNPALVRTQLTNTWATNPAVSEVFDVALLNTPAGRVGYIKLKAFYWEEESLDVGTVVENFRRAIEETFAGAIGIVIDVRGNPGGLIVLSEKLIQLFSPKEVKPSSVTMLANSLNEQIFIEANGKENRWSKEIHDAMERGDRYTKPLQITPTTEANGMGQVWFGPVVVLTDAACYSACDMFAAGMQDNGAGVIIGLDSSTGGGGANVMEHGVFRAIMEKAEKNPFERLPYGQDMRVAWRQTIRSGKHQGELIENTGVQSDIVVALKKNDIGQESKELMRQVHQYLDEMQPQYTSGLGTKPGGIVLLENGKEASWKEFAYGIDQLEIRIGTKTLTEIPVRVSNTPTEMDVLLKNVIREWHDQPVTLVGKREGKQKFRSVRELKWRGEYTQVPEQGLKQDFETQNIDPLKFVHLKGGAQKGWQTIKGVLRVGAGPQYDSNVLSRAFIPLDLKDNGGYMRLDIKLQAEDLNDSLRIYYLNPDTGERNEVFSGSELRQKIGVRIRLPFEWKRTDVVFEFESDENWNLEGPVIDNLRFD